MLAKNDISMDGAKILLELAQQRAPILLAHLAKAFQNNLDLESLLGALKELAEDALSTHAGEDSAAAASNEDPTEAELNADLDRQLTRVLEDVIAVLQAKGVVGEAGAVVLRKLGKDKSPVLFAALQQFHEDTDIENLFETLQILAEEGGRDDEEEGSQEQLSQDDSEEDEDDDKVHPMTAIERRRSLSMNSVDASDFATMTSQTSFGYQNLNDDEDSDEDEDDEDRRAENQPTLEMLTHPSNLNHLVVMLHDVGLVSVAERKVLLDLSDAADPRCLAAFDVYKDMLTAIENDSRGEDLDGQKEVALDDLTDTLMRVCKRELQSGPYDRRHSSFAMTDEGVVQLAPGQFGDDNDDAEEGGARRERNGEEDGIELQPMRSSNNVDDEGGARRSDKEEDGIELRTYKQSFDAGAEDDDLIGAGPGHVTEGDGEGFFTQQDRMDVVKMMAQGGVLDEDETIILELLVEKNNRHVGIMFKRYESTKDVVELTKNLKTIAQTAGNFLVSSMGADEDGDEDDDEEEDYSDEDEEEEEEENENEEGEEEGGEEDGSAYEAFFGYVEEMDLSEIETAALRLCIARSDSGLKAALEAHRITENGKDLQDTLWKLIRRTIEGVDANPNKAPPAPKPVAEEPPAAPGAAGGQDAEKFTDMERRYIFTRLVSELSKQSIISAVDGSELLSRFNAGDDKIHGALDSYEGGRSMETLVGTLKGLVDEGSPA
jgi:hypothetical protein